ncbi:HD-GYP domain-containing protein, partial [Gemmatimonadota bacterium]
IGQSGTNLLYDLLVSPIAIAVAFLFQELEVVGLLVALLPLLFVRHSYLTTLRLIQANRDLMKALVKAIETRDPYTSGHSVRVAALARRIATELGLSQRKVDHVETAALLHDIGKIEAVYSEILRKPDSLSDRERAIIESHVTKGVEVLRSLATFPHDVLAAVRGHHERVDGKGYPDHLRGEEIPLGARIIKVCDAVDAMLSDRPYRKALQLPQVREQLSAFAGMQFDQRIVEVVAMSDLLEEHATELTQERARDVEESEALGLGDGPLAAPGRVMGIPQDSIATS